MVLVTCELMCFKISTYLPNNVDVPFIGTILSWNRHFLYGWNVWSWWNEVQCYTVLIRNVMPIVSLHYKFKYHQSILYCLIY